jgi:hypothetical protein
MAKKLTDEAFGLNGAGPTQGPAVDAELVADGPRERHVT